MLAKRPQLAREQYFVAVTMVIFFVCSDRLGRHRCQAAVMIMVEHRACSGCDKMSFGMSI